VETGSIETRLLDKPMRYRVYLPPCYNAQAQTRYPSLYLLHGQNFDEEQWQRIGAFRTADTLITSGQVPPFLIILPYDYSSKQPTQYGFAQVFTELLLPQIDSTYRTQTQSEFRAIGGLSRGAGWALHLGIRNPQIFGAIGAHSPAVFYSDWTTLRYRLHDSDRNTFPPVFVDAGEHDSGYENILTLVALLNEMNIPHEWHAYQGYHEEKYWSAHVEEYLRWYAARWQNN
jgi:enterochelin esterase-like enzyme